MAQKLGVHEPLSLAGPTELDKRSTEALESVLRSHNLFEPESEAQKREEVLGKLNSICNQWVQEVSLEKVSLIDSV